MEFVLSHLVQYGFVSQELIQLMIRYRTPTGLEHHLTNEISGREEGHTDLQTNFFQMSFSVQVLHIAHRKMKFIIRCEIFIIIIVWK
jgi:hypothetical protein